MRLSVYLPSLNGVRQSRALKIMRAAVLAMVIGGTGCMLTAPAKAQTAPQVSTATRDFDVPAGPLSAALVRFGEQAQLQFSIGSHLTDGKRTAGVRGRYTPEQGLDTLLAGSGLAFRYAGPRTVVIEALPDARGARVLGPLRIEGAQSSAAVNGVNGSTDLTATENTGSYTSGALSVASKTAQSIKETPQSVSVITAQQIQDQNINDFSQMMDKATGITAVTTADGGPLAQTYYSRGFQITRLQIDGGAPISIANLGYGFKPQIDMAMYDHAEILRGADGLFNGYGSPGGVINLERKRPLDHLQTLFEVQGGSWDDRRAVADITGPLAFDGALRGRLVASYEKQNYFYGTANDETHLIYGVLEADLTASTVASVGFSYNKQDARPFLYGLPRYQDGADLGLSRSTGLAFPWNRDKLDTQEFFARVDQQLGKGWGLKINLTHDKQDRYYKYGYVTGAVNPETDQGPQLRAYMGKPKSTQWAYDFTLNGEFELFGHVQKLVVGGNYSKSDAGGSHGYLSPIDSSYSSPYTGLTGYPAVDVFAFDPNALAYGEPPDSLPATYFPAFGVKQSGAYATLQLTFWDPLHLIVGLRYSRYQYNQVYQYLCTSSTAWGCTGLKAGDIRATTSAKYSTSDFSWPPAMSLVYDLSKTLSAYASYTSIYEQQATYVDASGKSIDPITGSNIEAGLKWASLDNSLNASFAVYRLQQDKVGLGSAEGVSLLPDGVHWCCYSNDSDITRLSKGVDIEVSGEILPGWQLAAGYTYNDNKNKGTDNTSEGKPLVTSSPRNLLKLWTSYQFQNGERLSRLNLGGGVQAQSSTYSSGTACLQLGDPSPITGISTCLSSAPFQYTQKTYALFSGRAAYQLTPEISLALNINNIFDKRYYQTAGTSLNGNWYGEPRSFTLALRGKF